MRQRPPFRGRLPHSPPPLDTRTTGHHDNRSAPRSEGLQGATFRPVVLRSCRREAAVWGKTSPSSGPLDTRTTGHHDNRSAPRSEGSPGRDLSSCRPEVLSSNGRCPGKTAPISRPARRLRVRPHSRAPRGRSVGLAVGSLPTSLAMDSRKGFPFMELGPRRRGTRGGRCGSPERSCAGWPNGRCGRG